MGLDFHIPNSLDSVLTGILPNMKASLFNYALDYMLPLEGLTKDGQDRPPHSLQAPQGMVRKNLEVIEFVQVQNIVLALEQIAGGADPAKAAETALNDTAAFALTTVAADTPIDTARARLTWSIRLVNGTIERNKSETLGPSKWDDKSTRNARARERRADAKAAGTYTPRPRKRPQ